MCMALKSWLSFFLKLNVYSGLQTLQEKYTIAVWAQCQYKPRINVCLPNPVRFRGEWARLFNVLLFIYSVVLGREALILFAHISGAGFELIEVLVKHSCSTGVGNSNMTSLCHILTLCLHSTFCSYILCTEHYISVSRLCHFMH